MASGQFLDPSTLLRIAPVVTSTASVMIAWDSHLFLSSLVGLAPQRRTQVKELAPRYFEAFFWRGLPAIFGTFGLSAALGTANARSAAPSASWWYAAGSALALVHFAFVPKIMWKVRDAVDDVPGADGVEAIRGWLGVHYVRMALADIPSCACFLVAAAKALKSAQEVSGP
ncbi:hypothetical protein GGR52DRAFT_553689 [Hypoxylon sp. FL1284]|nr:hypothetical protein GGR52DRAFT_553689 [Hypoxylon sp. FL1284]